MNTKYRTGILLTLLVLPVLIFLGIKLLGKNHYNVPIKFPLDSVLTENGKYKVTKYHTIPSFEFKDQDGRKFNSESLKGKIYVADFFFTRCPDICPRMTDQLERVQAAFESNNDIKIVSFTVDPNFDSTQVLKQYANQNNAITDKWFFLTGNKDSIYSLAQTGFFLPAQEKEQAAFIHSERVILVDKESRIRGWYNGTEKEEVDRLITEIQVLQHEYANSSDSKK